MTGVAVAMECASCGASLSLADAAKDYGVRCASCGAATWLTLFPAAFEAPKSARPDLIVDDSEASCFYHQGKRAHVHCDSCGRFLCKLCQIELGGQNLCPSCLEIGQKKRTLVSLDNQRTMYDSIALALATLPVLTIWFVVVTAPASLFMSLWYWRRPLSIVPRSKVRYLLTILFALLEIAGILAIVYGLIKAGKR